jgi:hypothetical protein
MSHICLKSGTIVAMQRKTTIIWLGLTVIAIAGFTYLGPAEKTLGSNVRVVYLHGVWVWTSLAVFISAALAGLIGLVFRQEELQRWSRALGRTGLFFWITYLPLSLWAMQTNWNGLFLAEPRWRLALIFAISGLALQIGVTLVEDPALASFANLVYAVALFLALRSTENVLHPASPILTSDSWRIKLFFAGLLFLTLLLAWQVARLFHRLERPQALLVSSDRANESAG